MVAIQPHDLGAHVLHVLVQKVEQTKRSHAVRHFAYLQMRQTSLMQKVAALDVHAKEAIACFKSCLPRVQVYKLH